MQISPARNIAHPRTFARVSSVDAVRGLVMIIMALDHTRDFFHSAAMISPPEDLTRTWPALFATRWITHICAPAFMLLAGLSAWLWQSRGRTSGQLSAFLVKRGVRLILLDLVVMRFAMFFSLTSAPVILLVLWALGWSMIALAALIHLPVRLLAALSIAVICLHNLTDRLSPAAFGSAAWVWQILHQPGAFPAFGVVAVVAYPLIPWIFVMACGYCLGPVLGWPERKRFFLWTGLALSALFVVLRTVNVYGDPRPWSADLHPILSFLNATKYPPSLAFLLMTLGPILILLAAFDGVKLSSTHPLNVFGRVPLFFFVGHFFLAHALTFPLAQLRYGASAFLLQPLPSVGGRPDAYPAGYGYPLWAVYLAWLVVLALMYPACRYVAGLKERRKDWWLSYV